MKTKPKLDYLFVADFSDGTSYVQGPDDESLFHPKDAEGNGPNAYRDVCDRMEDVVRFHLEGNGHRYTVDLTDGHFEIDGTPFIVERKDLPISDMRLVYLRYTNVESVVEATANADGLFNWRKGKEVSRAHYVSRYVIGFTANQAGEEIEQTIAIKGA